MPAAKKTAKKTEPKNSPIKAVREAAEKVVKAAPIPAVEKKPRARKAAAPEVKLFVEYLGKQTSQEDMVAAVCAGWTGGEIKSLELYVKPEDSAVYYVINGSENGKIDL